MRAGKMDANGPEGLKQVLESAGFPQFIRAVAAYGWFVLIAMWGGTASYISRIRRKGLPFSVIELIGEWSISGFSGLVTMHICLDLGMSTYMTAAATGIAGHMGGRAIYLLEIWFTDRVGLKPSKGD